MNTVPGQTKWASSVDGHIDISSSAYHFNFTGAFPDDKNYQIHRIIVGWASEDATQVGAYFNTTNAANGGAAGLTPANGSLEIDFSDNPMKVDAGDAFGITIPPGQAAQAGTATASIEWSEL
jgi:hypothetical protein